MNSIFYIGIMIFLVYSVSVFMVEALRTQYDYSCGTWNKFCPELTGMMSILANQHLTLLEIRLAISSLALAVWGWVGYKYEFGVKR